MRTPGAQPYIFGCAGCTLSRAERSFFDQAQPWGFILFARNIDTPAQVAALCAELRSAVGWHAPILIDQEGGRVARLRGPHWHEFAPPLEAAGSADPVRAFWLRGRLIAADLRAVGIDVNCTPMLDVARPETHAFLKNRCYGSDPVQVARLARTLSEAQLAGGVLSVMKHIPGHGLGTVDSHLDLPRVSASADALRAVDFAPFAALNDLPMAMSAHVVFEALDPAHPATHSAIVIDLIRNEIGFGGLLMTDDISMQALSGTVGQRAAQALEAGCDIVLHCNGELAEMQEIAGALGPSPEPSRARAAAALAARMPPDAEAAPVDIAACAAELEALEQTL